MKRHISHYGRVGLAVVSALLALGFFGKLVIASPPDPQLAYPPLPEIDMTMSPARLAADSRPASLPDPVDPIALPDPAWRIGVLTDGLYALDYASLAAVDVPVTTADPNDYHLLWRGQEVALDARDIGASFDAGEAFYFYGEKFHGSTQDEKYTDENVYWLTIDETTPGLRMSTRDVAPNDGGAPVTWYTKTVRAEENIKYWARYSTDPGTNATWFWDYLRARNSPTTYTYQIDLDLLDNSTYSATLRVEFAAYTENQRSVRFSVNGHSVGDTFWVGRRGHVAILHFSSDYLKEGNNTLDICLLTDDENPGIYLNWFEFVYRRRLSAIHNKLRFESPLTGTRVITISNFTTDATYLYDISSSLHPKRLIGANQASNRLSYAESSVTPTHYVVAAEPFTPYSITMYHPPTDLLFPTEGADLIIITTAELVDTVEDLAQRRRDQGLRVRIVDVEDAYALFNGGIYHPEAIRSFVAYAYHHWPGPSPQYLLLFGDGNFNFKGYNPSAYGEKTPSLIPPYLGFLDPTQGEVPVDVWYGDVMGDDLPELSVGRLTVNSLEQARGVIDKLLAYEDQETGEWSSTAIFAADDDDKGEGFSAINDRLMRDYLPGDFTTRTIYLADYGTVASATQALTSTWSQGATLLTYIGHAAPDWWADEMLLQDKQLRTLQPTTKLPFIISLDCFDAFWFLPPEYPSYKSTDTRTIGEWSTTVLTDRGAIANFGPAGLGFPSTEEVMAQAIYEPIFDEGLTRLGPLSDAARDAASWSYMARIYTLLGDPTLILHWWDSLSVEPMSTTLTVNTSLTLSGAFTFTGRAHYGETFVVTPTWTTEEGMLDAFGVFTAPKQAGTLTVTAHLGQFYAPLTIHVVGGEAVDMTVTPDPLEIGAGLTATMGANITDLWGNVLDETPAWSADVGQIDPATGIFTAPLSVTQGHITATLNTLSDSVAVDVRPREPTTLTVTPNPLEMHVGEQQQMIAVVTDQWGNALDNTTVNWSTSVGAIDTSGLLTAPSVPAQGWITATYQTLIGRVEVNVRDYKVYLPLTLRN